MSEFGKRLRESIKLNGYTNQRISTEIGISRSQLQRWISGEQTPNVEFLVKICNALEVSADYLVLGKGEI